MKTQFLIVSLLFPLVLYLANCTPVPVTRHKDIHSINKQDKPAKADEWLEAALQLNADKESIKMKILNDKQVNHVSKDLVGKPKQKEGKDLLKGRTSNQSSKVNGSVAKKDHKGRLIEAETEGQDGKVDQHAPDQTKVQTPGQNSNQIPDENINQRPDQIPGEKPDQKPHQTPNSRPDLQVKLEKKTTNHQPSSDDGSRTNWLPSTRKRVYDEEKLRAVLGEYPSPTVFDK